jgi:hypothetical protein
MGTNRIVYLPNERSGGAVHHSVADPSRSFEEVEEQTLPVSLTALLSALPMCLTQPLHGA